MRVVSLFSGCGGTDLGFMAAGHEVVLANDFDRAACETYAKNFPWVRIIKGDICRIRTLPPIDCLVGCYPCQGFSSGGRRYTEEPRNRLYLEFNRALRLTKPKFFVV